METVLVEITSTGDVVAVAIESAAVSVAVTVTEGWRSIPLITEIGVSDIDYDTFTVTATIDPDGDTFTPVLHYGLTAAYGSTVNATEGEISAAGTVTFPVTGLTEETTYYFKIEAGDTDSIGYSVETVLYPGFEYIMLRSYMVLNPEQAKWFNTTEVATITERDNLIPTDGQWCYVADVEGSSKEYVYDANVALWYDANINGKSLLLEGSSGNAAKNELLSRLQEGKYLQTTYSDRTQCDFVYLLFFTGNIVSNALDLSLRWDCDGTIYTQAAATPVHAIGSGKGIVTISTDNWSQIISSRRFYLTASNFAGALPNFNLPTITKLWVDANNFSGNFPSMVIPSITDFRAYNCKFVGNFPNLLMPSISIFYVYNNNFSGVLPTFIFPLCTIFRVDLNKFSGNCPALYFPKIKGITSFKLDNNNFSSFESLLSIIYTNRANYLGTLAGEPALDITGNDNAEPLLATAKPENSVTPTTGKEFIYKLINDPDTEGFKKWNILYNRDSIVESAPAIVFTFDDGYADNYTVAKDIFETRGKKLTVYITTDWIDTAGFLTPAQITQLITDGHDIQCHGKTHTSFTALTEAQLNTELDSVDTFFTTNGWAAPNHSAYTYGHQDASVKTIVANHRLTGREYYPGQVYNSWLDKYEFYSYEMGETVSDRSRIDAIKAVIDEIAVNPRFAVVTGHNVCLDAELDTSLMKTSKSSLEELLDYAILKGVNIITISGLYELLD